MSRTRIHVASAVLLIDAVLVAGGCEEDGDTEYDRDRNAESAQNFNEMQQATRTVTPGMAATAPVITATATLPAAELRYATISSIKAVFDQNKFQMVYTLTMTGAFPQGDFVEWSGPTCGTIQGGSFAISSDQRADDTVVRPTFT